MEWTTSYMIPLNVTYSLLTTFHIHCLSATYLTKASRYNFLKSQGENDSLAHESDYGFMSPVLIRLAVVVEG